MSAPDISMQCDRVPYIHHPQPHTTHHLHNTHLSNTHLTHTNHSTTHLHTPTYNTNNNGTPTHTMDRLRAEEFYLCKPFSAENLHPTVSITNKLSSWQALGDLSEAYSSSEDEELDNADNNTTATTTTTTTTTSSPATATPRHGKAARDTVVKVTFHVEKFQPRDISVSICDDVLHVDATAHDDGEEVRRMMKRVRIPNEVDADKITSRWTTDGTLTIEVPIVHHHGNHNHHQNLTNHHQHHQQLEHDAQEEPNYQQQEEKSDDERSTANSCA